MKLEKVESYEIISYDKALEIIDPECLGLKLSLLKFNE